MKKTKTFMIELTSEKFDIETLVYLDDSEYAKLEKKSTEKGEGMNDTFLKDYIKKNLLFKSDLIYVKDYSNPNKNRYLVLNTTNMSSLFVSVVGSVDGKIDNPKEFLYKV